MGCCKRVIFNEKSFTQKNYEKNFYGGLFYLSDYLASSEFDSLCSKVSDLDQVDTLYSKSLKFFNGDVSEASLCLTFATLPFNDIKIRMPIIQSVIVMPLPSPGQKTFELRTANLPRDLFIDSPKNGFGDKDKLAHFFGNAFIGYNFGWFNLSKFMGIFVENVESGLFVEGGYDRRDLMVNFLGELFGKEIKNKRNLKPSNILKLYQLLYFRLYL